MYTFKRMRKYIKCTEVEESPSVRGGIMHSPPHGVTRLLPNYFGQLLSHVACTECIHAVYCYRWCT